MKSPFYTVFSLLFASCLISAVLSFLVGIGGAIVAAITQSKAAAGIFLVFILLMIFAVLISFVVLGIWQLLMARTVLMDDRIGRLADHEGEIFEAGLKPINNSDILGVRLRGCLFLVAASFLCWRMLPKLSGLLLSSLELLSGALPGSA